MPYQVLTNSLLNEVWKSILFTIRANLQGCPSTLAAKYVNYLYPVRTFPLLSAQICQIKMILFIVINCCYDTRAVP